MLCVCVLLNTKALEKQRRNGGFYGMGKADICHRDYDRINTAFAAR